MKTPSVIFLKKPIFCKCWEFLLPQSLSTANYLRSTFSGLPKKINILFRKSHLLFFKNNQIFNVPRKITVSVAFYANFSTISDFWKNHFFSRKTLCFFLKKPKHCTFWEILLSQSLSTANFLHLTLSGFERFQYFVSRNPSIFV